ncbi:hypothetical protein C0J52_14108 [Blattella germanica]|nr:hypothetical protein C0J52_14108 [Blattella germanica]
MRKVGLTAFESQIVSAVAPLDRMSGLRANNGRGLRVMLSVIIMLAAVFYALLMCIPTVTRFDSDHKPTVSFLCGPEGAILHHERCVHPACHSWDPKEVGELYLKNCDYDCETEITAMGRFDMLDMDLPSTTTDDGMDIDDYESSGDVEIPLEGHDEQEDDQYQDENEDTRRRREVNDSIGMEPEPPHLCYTGTDGTVNCKVYTHYSKRMAINVSLYSDEELNPRGQFCHYDLVGGSGKNLTCRIPDDLPGRLENKTCIVRCDVEQPDDEISLLAGSPCQRVRGDPNVTFWTYLVVRSIADIFPTAALALLAAVVVVATRETSVGRGDVGRQLAFGWLGLAIFGPIVGFISTVDFGTPFYWFQFMLCAILLFIAALVVIFAKSLPLGSPDWWWHARGSSSLGAHRYGWELVALTIVLILLGIFWSALDSFLPCRSTACHPIHVVFRAPLYALWSPWWLLLCSEALEFLTLSLAWLAAILYLRHLVPRHLTATGQGLAVAAHFCIGRCIGSIIAGALASPDSAAVVASLYFIIYYCCFKPRCLSSAGTGGSPSRPGVSTGPTTNGTYTPLRVYHNAGADGQKAQHRY